MIHIFWTLFFATAVPLMLKRSYALIQHLDTRNSSFESYYKLKHLAQNFAAPTFGESVYAPDTDNATLWRDRNRTAEGNRALWRDRNRAATHADKAKDSVVLSRPLKVLFGSVGGLASQVLRNQMIASLLSIHFKDRVQVTRLDIKSVLARKKTPKGSQSDFDICVGTKHYIAKFFLWCHQHGAVYVHDVVDSEDFMGSQILRGIVRARKKRVKQRFPYPSDSLFVSTVFQGSLLRNHFAVNAVVVPHHHTNIMSQHSPPERFKKLVAGALVLPNGKNESFIGTVGFVYGVNNVLNPFDLNMIKEIVCCKYKMRLRLVNQELQQNVVITKIWDYACGSSKPVYHSFGSGIPLGKSRRQLGTLMSPQDFWKIQAPFHNNSLLAPVDIAILWPPNSSSLMPLVRPVTRLVHWWSHGTPTIFFPYKAYTETADAHNYYQCNESALSDLRHARSLDVVDKLLNVLLKNSKLRECLSARGLQIAEAYSPERIASRFVAALEETYWNKNAMYKKKPRVILEPAVFP